MLESLGYIQFPTHRVAVSKDLDNDRIYCFKSTDQICDFASFTTESEAADYIITPLRQLEWHLEIEGD